MADINNLPQPLTIDQLAERLAVTPSATSGGPGADMIAAPEPPRLFDPVDGDSHVETARPGPIQGAVAQSPGLAAPSPIVERRSASKRRSQQAVGRLVARGDAPPYRKERRTMPRTEPLPHLLTIEQLADHLGVTVRHVRRQIAERRVPYIKVGRLVRFDPAEITRWIDGSRHPEGSPSSTWR
jgi:excisionase family DNA binding protein